jgi:hypothetical protein
LAFSLREVPRRDGQRRLTPSEHFSQLAISCNQKTRSALRTPESRVREITIALILIAIGAPLNTWHDSINLRFPINPLFCSVAESFPLKNEMPARLILSPKRTSSVCCAWVLLVQPADLGALEPRTRNVTNTHSFSSHFRSARFRSPRILLRARCLKGRVIV